MPGRRSSPIRTLSLPGKESEVRALPAINFLIFGPTGNRYLGRLPFGQRPGTGLREATPTRSTSARCPRLVSGSSGKPRAATTTRNRPASTPFSRRHPSGSALPAPNSSTSRSPTPTTTWPTRRCTSLVHARTWMGFLRRVTVSARRPWPSCMPTATCTPASTVLSRRPVWMRPQPAGTGVRAGDAARKRVAPLVTTGPATRMARLISDLARVASPRHRLAAAKLAMFAPFNQEARCSHRSTRRPP
jgi:hypothetical protein